MEDLETDIQSLVKFEIFNDRDYYEKVLYLLMRAKFYENRAIIEREESAK